MDSKVWSNAFFLVPFILTLVFESYIHSMLILLVAIFSSAYHLGNEKLRYFDKTSAYLLIVYNLYLLLLAKNILFTILALSFVMIGFYFFFYKHKDDWEWHLSSAIITTFCVLA